MNDDRIDFHDKAQERKAPYGRKERPAEFV